MDIADILPKKKVSETKDYYWALAIEPGWVQAGIWTTTDGEAEVLAEEKYKQVETSVKNQFQLDGDLLPFASL